MAATSCRFYSTGKVDTDRSGCSDCDEALRSGHCTEVKSEILHTVIFPLTVSDHLPIQDFLDTEVH